ncbi:MAG: hypothetical protein K9N01_05580 [Cephaloticoccus sp.]|nr:hypothetical protein [Cephaloticoccus sp.]
MKSSDAVAPRYYTFWSINGPLERGRLFRQLADFKTAGLHGVVFHPRFYPGIPPYLSADYLAEVSACILRAKELGLRFWLYDENGWPSGTGDGRVLANYPDSGAMRLDLTPSGTLDSIGSFSVDEVNQIVSAKTPGAKTWHLTPRKINYVDSLDPRVLGHFLELIHEPYRTGLDPAAWDYVEAIFFDEPESGMIKDPFPAQAGIPWSRIMPEKLQAAFGNDYLAILPLLFARGAGCAAIRIKFWELVTDTLIGGFFAPYHAWCQQHGKQFIGHVKGEEHPLFQLPMVGSCHRTFRHFSMPGIDALERFPSLDFFPRQASSVARQFGEGRSMVECFGGSGWGSSPEDLERYLHWLGRNGITDFVFHLSQYRLDTPALTDWPPSEPLHLSWKDAFPAVLDRVSRALTTNPPAKSDTLVVAPYRGLMAKYEPWELMQTNMHNATTFPDTPASRMNSAFLATLEQLKSAGIAYDLTDERTLEEDGKRLPDGRVQLGQVSYAHLVIDPAAQLHGDCANWQTPPPKPVVRILSTDGPSPFSTIPLTWNLPAPPENAWLIEPTRLAPRQFSAIFTTDALAAGLTLHFADEIVAATLDGNPLQLIAGDEGPTVELNALGGDEHQLTFETVALFPAKPYVWLKGRYTLQSRTPYTPGPNGTIRTDGPFVASVNQADAAAELVAGGFPFLHQPLVAETDIDLAESSSSLAFPHTFADAMRVALDGTDAGWIWGPDWHLSLDQPLSAGPHTLRVGLVPNSFNHFGPHHYYNGDWPVVSPGQILGDKNFADAPDAPDHTHVPAWHFKLLQLPTQLIAQS